MSVAVLIAGCAQPVVKEEVKPAVKEVAKPEVKPLTEEEAKKTGLHGTSEALIYWSGKAARDLAEAKKIAPAPVTEVKAEYALSKEDFEKMRQVYFDRCAGCHGVLRKGATGKALTPDKTRPQGSAILRAFIYTGTGGGMPGWGKQGVLSDAETDLMVKYIQNDPPIPPQWSLPDMKKSWKVLIPPEKRPTAPQHKRDWQNFFVVTLRDAGKIAIIDGDTKEVVNTVDSGYAVHIVRMSMSGRYVYTIGRDGKATIIDLWMEKPDTVAEIRTGLDARSIDVSKYTGFEDKYAVVGCYWPPQFVILDGSTLEPIKVVSTLSYTYDTEEFHPEPRVASIVASHFRPEWV
ncbi:MAG: c-type cytochrome, partial [Planctomycetes bacterium]|nr:c-type cytochrome [Planctomycetota bacterium]